MNMRLRKIIFLSGVFVFALGVHVASAQMTGVISYDVTIDVYMSLTPEQEILKTRLEEFRTTKMLLFFSPDESIYKQDEEARQNRNGGRNFGGGGSPGGFSRGNGGGFNGGGGNPGFGGGAGGRGNGGGFNGGGNGGGNPGGFSRDNGGAGGAGGQGGFDRGAQGGFGGPGGFRGGIGGIAGFGRQGNAEIYISQNSRRTITKQELLGKTYIIEDSLELSPWKLGTDRKIILGYLCKLAYYTDNSDPAKPQEITAWYTDKIRPFVGPENFNTLPGAVLAVDINAGEKVLVATKIDLRPLADAEAIMPPSRDDKAIVTTPANYKKIEEEQLKNLNAGRTPPRN